MDYYSHEQWQDFNTLEERSDYISKVILPAMAIRRARTRPITPEELHNKFYNPPSSDKPGEDFELAQACVENLGHIANVDTVLEIADIIFYALQDETGVLLQAWQPYLHLIGYDMNICMDFCIVKYSTRLKIPLGNPDYKDIETHVMEAFLQHVKQTRPEYLWWWNGAEISVV